MNNENAIVVKGVSKKFKIYFDKGNQLKEKMLFWKRNRHEDRWVLNDVSFEIKKGEAVGIIGENGCGKSTMLKLLTKIIYPSKGTIETQGRISCLIELGAGFHPDMTGRENIYTNAAIFGLTRKEIDDRLDSIIEFSELGEYIDNPVRTYSSGMYMRLAFSVAINVDADVLLVDEILAVGDAAFQAKCFNRMREIKAKGTTIVIVSHSMGQIEQICDRTIWICNGKIRESGYPFNVHRSYMEYMGRKGETPAPQQVEEPEEETPLEAEEKGEEEMQEQPQAPNRWGNQKAKITQVRMLDDNGKPCTVFPVGARFYIEADYVLKDGLENPLFGFGIFRNDGMHCYGTNTAIDNYNSQNVPRKGTYTVMVEHCPLMAGEYSLDVAISEQMGMDCDYFQQALRFKMYSPIQDVGNMYVAHIWSFKEK